MYDQTAVLAYLQGIGFIALDHPASPPQSLFPTGWEHPTRAIDLTRRSQYGYWSAPGPEGTFITIDAEVTNLLGSCGWYRGGGYY